MNVWSYLDANPVAVLFLSVVLGWALARIVRAWRDRRPVKVRLVLVCPKCEREAEHQGEGYVGVPGGGMEVGDA